MPFFCMYRTVKDCISKQKIQSAAMQLFVQKGFGSTNVQDIADTASIRITRLQDCRKTSIFSSRRFHPNKRWISL
ncbi:TetR family transcriptional regulator [Brevibacillus fortis]|uniref:TetR family transcriptional regulator n=2 Tax=Brevibacillus fortis TaxID=2126352 RepID=UPI003D256F10